MTGCRLPTLKPTAMPTFTASRLTQGNTVFPTTIELRNGFLYCRKLFIPGIDTLTIPYRNIASVRVVHGILFSDLIVETSGRQVYLFNGFTHHDAARMARLLKSRIP